MHAKFFVKIYLFEKQSEKEEKTDHPSLSSLPRQSQWPDLGQCKDGSFIWVFLTGSEAKALGPSSTAFLGHLQGDGLKVEYPRLRPAPQKIFLIIYYYFNIYLF